MATASLFFRNSVIWETVVMDFQNALQSPTLHALPHSQPFGFSDDGHEPSQSQRCQPHSARRGAHFHPQRPCATAIAAPCTPASGSVARWL